MMVTKTQELDVGQLGTLLSEDTFWPSEPQSLKETGLSEAYVEGLTCKLLLIKGTLSGRSVADCLCLPFAIVDRLIGTLRTRQWVTHAGAAPFNDYYYSLTEEGSRHAHAYKAASGYCGPAPVPLLDYSISVDAQAISGEPVRRDRLESALRGISVSRDLLQVLGPALNSGSGIFLHGAPGNGKSTLARRITMCFGQSIWVPHAITEDGQLIKLLDATYHREATTRPNRMIEDRGHDRRWVKIRRPIVLVGGELTMDGLEIRHDPRTNISEAPLQMKSNCGCLLIDDFGRQRIAPTELLNRWIVPLENRRDYLTLSTGKKIEIPFEQLIIFSTNLEPHDLVDEAFLRRIPYTIKVADPSEDEFYQLFEAYAAELNCEYRSDAVRHLLDQHYRPQGRSLRRCHARDFLKQLRNYCTYNGLPLEMRPDYIDIVSRSFNFFAGFAGVQ
jgi:hypothetical protein